jgi:hypothetical protein
VNNFVCVVKKQWFGHVLMQNGSATECVERFIHVETTSVKRYVTVDSVVHVLVHLKEPAHVAREKSLCHVQRMFLHVVTLVERNCHVVFTAVCNYAILALVAYVGRW